MADYTVRVEGVNNGGGGAVPPQVPPTNNPPAPQPESNRGSNFVPSSDQLVNDFRKLVQTQGGVIVPGSAQMNQLYRQFGDQQRNTLRQQVSEKYDTRRQQLDEKYETRYNQINNAYKSEQKRLIDKYGNSASNQKAWEENEKWRDEQLDILDKDKKKDERGIDREEKDELASALRELTSVLRDSKEAAERDDERGDNTDSYLGRLRADRRKILEERDNAATREEALAANRRLAEKDEEIRKVTSNGQEGKPVFDRFMMGTQGVQQLFGGLESGDMSGAVMGLGSTISGFGGLSLKAAMRVAGIAALAAGAIKSIHGSNERYNGVSDLAAFRSTSGGRYGTSAMEGIVTAMQQAKVGESATHPGVGYENFDIDYKQFSNRAANTVRNRGTGEGWYSETLRQIGLERYFGLQENSLGQGSSFDRYGQAVTEATKQLISSLSYIGAEGANSKDFSRVQEKYDFRQQLMESYMSRTDKPDFALANQSVVAMNQIKGITHDQRDASDYASFQNAIQNPKNDRMKALLYSTVQEMMPEMVGTNGEKYTAMDAGRMDLIDRAIRNPKNEGKIMQAMIQKISEMYGGTNTQMGYFAFKNLFPEISPDRLDQYVTQFSNKTSDASWSLAGSEAKVERNEAVRAEAKKNMDLNVVTASQYTHNMTQAVDEIQKTLRDLVDRMTLNANVFDPQAVAAAKGQ